MSEAALAIPSILSHKLIMKGVPRSHINYLMTQIIDTITKGLETLATSGIRLVSVM